MQRQEFPRRRTSVSWKEEEEEEEKIPNGDDDSDNSLDACANEERRARALPPTTAASEAARENPRKMVNTASKSMHSTGSRTRHYSHQSTGKSEEHMMTRDTTGKQTSGSSSSRGRQDGLPEDNRLQGTCIKVVVRVRPFNDKEKARQEELIVDAPSNTTLTIKSPKTDEVKQFNFDRVFWSVDPKYRRNCGQDILMEELGQELVEAAIDGYNCCLFAYGQTGSGKTHTMFGSEAKHEIRGLLPRIVEGMFMRFEKEKQDPNNPSTFKTSVSYVEIYNETIRDLLAPEEKANKRLEIRHHPTLGCFVANVGDNPVFCWPDVKKLLDWGIKARAVGATLMNEVSSRSHCIFTLETSRKQILNGKSVEWRSKMNLVDLAGSERQKRTQSTGAQWQEGANINKSLSTLALIVSKLAESSSLRRRRSDNTVHIPFRNSKLTYLLQESLSGNSRTTMIAALSPASMSYEETLSTLHFAQSVKAVKMTSKKNEKGGEILAEELEKECARLQQLVAAGQTDSQELLDITAMKEKYGRNLEEQLVIAKTLNEQRDQILAEAGLTTQDMSKSLGLKANTPQLLNVLPDPQLSNCLVYFLLKDQKFSIGTGEECKIFLSGLGMESMMATLENKDDLSVTLKYHTGVVRLNGRQLTGDATVQLQNNDRLIFGYSYCFRVVFPAIPQAQDKVQREVSDTAEDTTNIWEKAMNEVEPDSFETAGHSALFLRNLETCIGEVRALKFTNDFRKVSLQVEEANALIKQYHPESSYVFSAEVLQDFVSASGRVPECVVRLKKVPRGKERLREIVKKSLRNVWKEAMNELKPGVDDYGTFETVMLLPDEEFKRRLNEFEAFYASRRRRRTRSSFCSQLSSQVDEWSSQHFGSPGASVVDPFARLVSIGNDAEQVAALQEAEESTRNTQEELDDALAQIEELKSQLAARGGTSAHGSVAAPPAGGSAASSLPPPSAGPYPPPPSSLAGTTSGSSPSGARPFIPSTPSFGKNGGCVPFQGTELAPLEVQEKLLGQVRQAFEQGLQRDAEESRRLLQYTERLQACEAHHLRTCRDLQAEVRAEAKRLAEQSDLIRREAFEQARLRDEVGSLRGELADAQSSLEDSQDDAEVALEMAEFYMHTGHQGRIQDSEAACMKELLVRIRSMHDFGGSGRSFVSTTPSPRW